VGGCGLQEPRIRFGSRSGPHASLLRSSRRPSGGSRRSTRPGRWTGPGWLGRRRRAQILLQPLEVALHGAAHLEQVATGVSQQPIYVAAEISHAGADAAADRGEVLLGHLERLGDAVEAMRVVLGPCW